MVHYYRRGTGRFGRTMGIIDVIVEKPAFRREERAEEPAEERAEEPAEEATSETTHSGRNGKLRLTAGALAVGLLGAITLRKLRNRRADRGSEPETGPEREAGLKEGSEPRE